MILPSSWLTSELARDRRREPPSLSLSSETHGSLMSSVNSDRIENRDERVPPVETSLMRLYPLKEEGLNGSGDGGESPDGAY